MECVQNIFIYTYSICMLVCDNVSECFQPQDFEILPCMYRNMNMIDTHNTRINLSSSHDVNWQASKHDRNEQLSREGREEVINLLEHNVIATAAGLLLYFCAFAFGARACKSGIMASSQSVVVDITQDETDVYVQNVNKPTGCITRYTT